jgi:type I thyroxine 5'-deiodinase
MNNSVNEAYAAWPIRIYVITRDGKIAFKSKMGPTGFRLGAAEAVLRKLVG